MAQYLPLPDGTYLKLQEGESPDAGLRRAQAKYPEAFAPAKPPAAPKESTIFGEIARGAKQLGSSTRTGIGALVAPEEAARAGVERGQQIAAEAGEGPSFAALRKVYEERGLLPAAGELVSQIPRAVAGQLPQLAALAGGAKLGAMAGAPLGPAGVIGGGILGAGATLLPQTFGSFVERQAAEQMERGEPIQIDRAKAAGAAALATGVEAAGTAFVLGKRVVKGVLGIADDAGLATAKARADLVKAAERSTLGAAGRGAAVGLAEIPVEVAQAVIERAQAGLDVLSPEAISEYGENAYLAGLVGPTIGAATRVTEPGAARQKLAAEEQVKVAAERKAAREAEEAKKKDPQYLLDLETRYKAALQQKAQLDAAAVKPPKGSDPATMIAHREAVRARDEFAKTEMAEVAREYASRKKEIDALNAQRQQAAELAAQEVPQMEQKLPFYGAAQETIPGLEPAEAPSAPEKEAPVDYAGQAQRLRGYLDDLRERAQTTTDLDAKIRIGEEFTQIQKALGKAETLAKEEDQGVGKKVESLRRKMATAEEAGDIDAQVALAKQLKALGVTDVAKAVQPELPGMQTDFFAPAEVAKRKEAELTARAEALTAARPDLAAPVEETDPLALWKASVEETEEQATEELLRPNFEAALTPSGPPTVAVAPGITPIQNPTTLLKRIDDLITTRDKVAADADTAFAAGNKELGVKKAQEREAAQTALNNLEQTEGPGRALVSLRKAQDTALVNATQLIDDLKMGRTLGGPEAATASSTPQTLINQINKQRDAYITAMVQEAAATRRLFAKALPQEEATKAANQARSVFNEWVTRSMAQPVKAVNWSDRMLAYMQAEDAVQGAYILDRPWVQQMKQDFIRAQMTDALTKRLGRQRMEEIAKGTAELKGAETELPVDTRRAIESKASVDFNRLLVDAQKKAFAQSTDPRPLEERRFGAYRAATQVLQEQLQAIASKLKEVPRAPQRVEPTLKMQFPETEAAKVAEAKGETAQTLEGQLRRRRDYAQGLIDQAFQTRRIPGIAQMLLTRAQDFLPTAPNTLLDAVENVADRLVRGQTLERSDLIALRDEVRAASARPGEAEVAGERVGQRELFPAEERRALAPKEERGALGLVREKPEAFQAVRAKESAKAARVAAATQRSEQLTQDIRTELDRIDKERQATLEQRVEERRDSLQSAWQSAVKKAKNLVLSARKAAQKPQVDALKKEIDAIRKGGIEGLNKETIDRLLAARAELDRISGEFDTIVEAADFLPIAQANKWVAYERGALEQAEKALAETRTPQTVSAVQQQKAALQRAEQARLQSLKGEEKAAEAARMRAAQTGLGLPGQRRVEGRVEAIEPEKTAAERAAEAEEAQAQAREEAVARREAKEAERTALEQRIADLEQSVERRKGQATKLRKQTAALESSLAKAKTDKAKAAIQAQLKAVRESGAQKNIDALNKDLAIARGQLAALGEAKPRKKGPATAISGAGIARQRPLRTGYRKALEGASEALRKEREGEVELPGVFEFGPQEKLFSRGATSNPSTTASVRTELSKAFTDLGRVQTFATVEDLIAANPQYEGKIPSDARGFVDTAGNKAFLIAENINQGQALSVLLHEVGAHIGLKNVLGEAQYNTLVNAVKSWEKRADNSTEAKVAQAARARVEAAETKASQVNDELLAYAIEEAVNAGVKPTETKGVLGQWLGRVAALFRKALEKFGLPPKTLDAQGIVDMAFGAAKMEMRGEGVLAPRAQIKAPTSASFERWFGDSKVVDENGKPLVVYHGSNADITAFDPTKLGAATEAPSAQLGFFFASDPAVASTYAKTTSGYDKGLIGAMNRFTGGHYEWMNETLLKGISKLPNMKEWAPVGRPVGGNVLPVYLSLQNPLVVDQQGKEYREQSYYDILIRAKAEGHDGAIIRNTFDEGFEAGGNKKTDIYVVFEPTQIKSAIGNIGTYDPKNPDILFSRNLPTAARVADQIVGQQKGWLQKLRENFLGIGGRAQFVDMRFPLEEALKRGGVEDLDAMQAMYYVRMYDQKMHFTSEAITEGVPQVVELTRKDGRTERVIEAKTGANLTQAYKILTSKEVIKEAGSADAANKLVTLYMAAIRGANKGYDKLNFGRAWATQEIQRLDGELKRTGLEPAERANLQKRKASLVERLDTLPTVEDIKASRAEIEANPVLREAFDKVREVYNEYNRNLLELAVQTGAISRDHARTLLAQNDYIPYYRMRGGVAEMVIGDETPIRIGNIKDNQELQELVGGDEPILDFLTSSMQNTSMLVDMSLRNIAMKNAMFELRDVGLATIAKEPKGGAPKGSVTFKKDGEDYYAMVNTDALGISSDLLVKGLAGIPTMFPMWVRAMGVPARWLRRAIVAAPPYWAKQVFRDSLGAAMSSGADIVPVLGALRQIGKDNVLERRGITGGQVFTGLPEDKKRMMDAMQSGKVSLTRGMAWLEATSAKADALTRKNQYENYLKQGLSEMEATYMALESMNFSKRGLSPSVHYANILIPFFNSQIQGLDALYKAFTGKMPMNERLEIRQKLWTRGMFMFAISMAYAWAMQDDEAYKNAKPEEKYSNWFVPLKNFGIDATLRLPIPFELGYFFKALPEAIVNSVMREEGAKEAREAFTHIAQQTVPGGSSLGMPAAIKTGLEATLGVSSYTGRPIESAQEQMLEPGYRTRENTTELARQIGEMTNFSPIKLEFLVRGYTGSMGMAALAALSAPFGTSGPTPATKRLTDLPVFGTMFQPKDASGIIDATYEKMTKVNQLKETYEDLLNKGRTADAQQYYEKHKDDMAFASLAGSFKQFMGEITQVERAVRAAPNLTPDQKRQKLDELRQAKIRTAQSVRGMVEKSKPQAAPV